MAVGWSLLAYPAFYVIILSTLGFGLGIGHNGLTFGAIFTALLTVLAAGSMVALPALLGLAIRWRNKILWVLSAVTGIVTAITLVRYQFPHL
ncbi:hypothetical protein [Arthrobacter sp. GMC3]|uniref:hypothetical protein n=1 Tax=Arthrobacter sp. GMC3 TaxID=2058894 RepID=UPI000CE2E17D|nr:hypothetical protein [Arthrobacter sp. GMC3]